MEKREERERSPGREGMGADLVAKVTPLAQLSWTRGN